MASPCDQYQELINSLNDRIDKLQAKITDDVAAGIRTDPLRAQIRNLQAQKQGLLQALEHCLHGSNIWLIGSEVTQAIQFFTGLPGQGSGYAPTNSVRLVAGKHAMLRAYAGVVPISSATTVPAMLDGTVTLASASGVTVLSSSNGPLQAQNASDLRRDVLDSTLNFLLPVELCKGQVACTVEVHDPNNPADSDQILSELDFVDVPNLPVHAVLIHYTGVNYFYQPVDKQPSCIDFFNAMEMPLKLYPIPGLILSGFEVLPWSDRTATKDVFSDLKAKIGDLRAMSGSNDLYCGVLPPEAGSGANTGLGGDFSALFFSDDSPTAAHEMGHALGRDHTQCSVHADGEDTNYPQYPNYPQGSIGEFGVDVATGEILDPQTNYDVMSYCYRWIGPYTYEALIDAIRSEYLTTDALRVQIPNHGSAGSTRDEPFLNATLRIHRRGPRRVLDVLSAFTINRATLPRGGPPTSVAVELMSGKNQVLGVYACRETSVPSCGCGQAQDAVPPFRDVNVCARWDAGTKAVRIVERGEVLATLKVAGNAPSLKIVAVSRKKQRLFVTWQGRAAPKSNPPLQYGLRYSADGQSWRALCAGVTDTQWEADLDLLPGGDACRVQVVAYAGFRTTVVESEPFAVRKKPRRAHVLRPRADAAFESGGSVFLAGGAFSPDFGMAPDRDVRWQSDRDGLLGHGATLIVQSLSEGKHRLTVAAPDGQGKDSTADVLIHIGKAGPKDRPSKSRQGRR